MSTYPPGPKPIASEPRRPLVRGRTHSAGNRMKTNEYTLGIGTLALVNSGLAQAKGRSALAWFFLSIVLGPVATFLIVVLAPPQPRVS